MNNPFRQLIHLAHQAWFFQRRKGLRGRIQKRYGNSSAPDVKEVLDFLNRHPELPLPTGMVPPYDWAADYAPEKIAVQRDATNGLLYVRVNDQKVYFPRNFSPPDVQRAVSIGKMEQDARSPHCYVGGNFTVDAGDVAVFIGASDGLFCLSLIERLSKAYLFEPNADWHEPLRATFAYCGDKVEIIAMAVDAKDGAGRVSLDSFFVGRPHPNYIQVDVDGVERDVLAGTRNLLRGSGKLRLSICTYHKRLDFEEFEQLLSGCGFHIHHSPGFFLIGVRMPYLRRGILYASRSRIMPEVPTPRANE
jgi:hypothetical protein